MEIKKGITMIRINFLDISSKELDEITNPVLLKQELEQTQGTLKDINNYFYKISTLIVVGVFSIVGFSLKFLNESTFKLTSELILLGSLLAGITFVLLFSMMLERSMIVNKKAKLIKRLNVIK